MIWVVQKYQRCSCTPTPICSLRQPHTFGFYFGCTTGCFLYSFFLPLSFPVPVTAVPAPFSSPGGGRWGLWSSPGPGLLGGPCQTTGRTCMGKEPGQRASLVYFFFSFVIPWNALFFSRIKHLRSPGRFGRDNYPGCA